MKVCTRCGQVKALVEYNRRSSAQDGRQSACRACSQAGYLAYADVHRARVAARNANQRAEILEHLVQYLVGHPCCDCGEPDLRVLEFDHRPGSDKSAEVSVLIRLRRPWAEVLAEIMKCDVRCANCHRRRTYAGGTSWRERTSPSSEGGTDA